MSFAARTRERPHSRAAIASVDALRPSAATGTKPATAAPTGHPAPSRHPESTPIVGPSISGCPVFPSTNVWNKRVDSLPVAKGSSTLVGAIGATRGLHPDFGSYAGYGIPYNLVDSSTPRATVTFDYDDESDHVGYPIPSAPKVEAGSDSHLLSIDTSACELYELFDAHTASGHWTAGSGATWDLRSNALRPGGWTSADAAGLPIFPGLVRYDEVAAGQILHAIRFTAPSTCAGYVYPARHEAGSGSCSAKPPMGLRVRLKASVSLAGYGQQAKVILVALQRYGMILADNGSAWYLTGAADPRWNDDVLHALGQIHGSDLEVVDTSGLVNG